MEVIMKVFIQQVLKPAVHMSNFTVTDVQQITKKPQWWEEKNQRETTSFKLKTGK